MQPNKVLIGLELRVGLDDGEQPTHGTRQLRVGVGHLLRVVRLHGADQPGVCLRDLGENVLLVLGIALHRVHEVGNEIGAAL